MIDHQSEIAIMAGVEGENVVAKMTLGSRTEKVNSTALFGLVIDKGIAFYGYPTGVSYISG